MKPIAIPAEKVSEHEGASDPCYAAWERAKIERGLTQSRDRAAMIPVEQVWAGLGVDR